MHRVFYFSNLCKKSESPIRVIWIRLKKNRPCKHSCWLSFFFFFLHFLIRSLEESLILTTEFWKIIKLIQLRIKSIYDNIRIWSAVVLAAFQTQVLHILLGFLNLFFFPQKNPTAQWNDYPYTGLRSPQSQTSYSVHRSHHIPGQKSIKYQPASFCCGLHPQTLHWTFPKAHMYLSNPKRLRFFIDCPVCLQQTRLGLVIC